MKKKLKRLSLALLALAVVGFAALNVLAYRHAHAMMYFSAGGPRTQPLQSHSLGAKINRLISGVNLPRPHSSLTPTNLSLSCKSITLEGTNKIRLGAWYCPATNAAQSPLVLLFHGYGSEKTATIPEAKVFLEMGFSVMLVDFRGSGESSESYTTIGFLEGDDVATAVRYAKNQLPHSRIILYGQSMGAAAILRAVHGCDVKPDAIIVEAVFDTLLNTVRHRFQAMGVPSFPSANLLVFWGGRQAGFNGFNHNPVDYAASVHCPILFLHGAADNRARVEDARRVHAAVPGQKQFKEFPGLKHENILAAYPQEWRDVVSQFLKSAALGLAGK